jgi:hypothetical protein
VTLQKEAIHRGGPLRRGSSPRARSI